MTGLAGCLQTAGVNRGDRVAVVLPNGPEIVALLFALAALGATMAPLNPAYTEPEYRFFLDDLDPQLVIVGAGAAPAARTAAAALTIAELLPWEAEAPPRLAGVNTRCQAPNIHGGPDDVALLLHTSGTTSRPKQVPLLQRNLDRPGALDRCPLRAGRTATSRTARCRSSTCTASSPRRSPSSAPAAPWSFRAASRPRRFWGQAAAPRRDLVLGRADAHQMILDQLAATPSATLRFARSCSSALSPELLARRRGASAACRCSRPTA